MASEIGVQNIQHTNGTTAMTIDSSGRVSLPQQIGFLAEGSASYVAYSSLDTLAYNSVTNAGQFNNGGHYDITTYKFTAPIAGMYFFHASAYANAVTSSGLRLQHDNSSGVGITSYRYYDTNTRGKQISAVVNMSVGDKIYVLTEDAASLYLGYYGRFCGYFIG